MRKVCILSVALLSACGCCSSPCNTMGWQFSMGKAPMAFTPAIVSASAPMYGVSGLGAVPTLPTALAVQPRAMAAAAPCGPAGPAAEPIGPPRALAAPGLECTMQSVCDALTRIETKLGTGAGPKRLPPAPAD